ncbi:MAG: hypothetical protein R3B90_23145 [Planctomycetaceae bacterium]
MPLLQLQFRLFAASLALLLAVHCRLVADDAATEPAADGVLMPEPFATVHAPSVDRLLEVTRQLLAAGGRGQWTRVMDGYLGYLNELRGIDRSRPLALLLYLDRTDADAEPVPVACLPLSSIKDLRATLVSTGNSLEAVAVESEYLLKLGGDEFTLRVVDGYAWIVPRNRPQPPLAADDVRGRVATPATEDDLYWRIDVDGIPPANRRALLDQLHRDAERELAQQAGEDASTYEVRSDLQRYVYEGTERLLTETGAVTMGVRLTGEPPELQFHAGLHPRAESGVNDYFRKALVPKPRSFALNPAAALSGSVHFRLNERERELSSRFVKLLRRQTNLETQAELPVAARQAGVQLLDALAETTEAGWIDIDVCFAPTDAGRMVLLLRTGLESIAEVDAALRELLPLVAQSNEVESVELAVAKVAGIDWHRLIGRGLQNRDRRLYGDDARMLIGAGDAALWFAVGGEASIAVLTRLLETDRETVTGPAAVVEFRLRPWLRLAEVNGASGDRSWFEAARQVLADAELGDRVAVSLESTDESLLLSGVAEAGLVRIIALQLLQRP